MTVLSFRGTVGEFRKFLEELKACGLEKGGTLLSWRRKHFLH